MKRLSLINELQALEFRRGHFETLKRNMDSFYFKECEILTGMESEDFKFKEVTEWIKVDNELFKKYLKEEIEELEEKIQIKIEAISKFKEPS